MRKRRTVSEINIVPYVDVMLVLLVIFMVTAPIMTHGVKVDLPQAAAKALPSKDDFPLVVTVDKFGRLYLSISSTPTKPIKAKYLQAEVIAALQLNPKRQVLVRGDKNVNYDIVLSAMVLLQQIGVASIGLETQDSLTIG